MKIPNRCLGLAAIVFLAVTGVFADSPAVIETVFPDTGGTSVGGSGRWSVIANDTPVGGVNCPVQIYQQIYDIMTWSLFETIGSVLTETCTTGSFGHSSSLSGNVLVVGVPDYDSFVAFPNPNSCSPALTNRGAFAVYEWTGGTTTGVDWPRLNVGNCASQQLRVDAAQQANANYGFSVSVSQQGTTSNYIIAIGSPNFDGVGADSGKVELFRFDGSTNAMTTVATVTGGAAGDQLGYSVTVSGTYILVGAPGTGDGLVNDSPGAARLYELPTNNTPQLRQTITQSGSDSLGREVSLSQQVALVSGDVSAYSYKNSITSVPWNFTAAGGPFASGGGDVTQGNGIATIGVNNPGTYQGATYRNVVSDTPVTDAVIANPGVDYGLADPSLVGDDIRLTRESLWFADPGNDRALLYQYPAGFGARITTPYQYAQRSIPCNAEGKTVSELFGYLGVNNTDFVVYLFDQANRTNAKPYKKLADSYVFTAADAKYSIFIAVRVPQYLSVASCTGFTVPTVVGTAVRNGGTAFAESIVAQKDLALPAYVNAAGARLMVNNPFPRAVRASDIRFRHATGAVQTLQAADNANFLSSTLYVYDPNSTIPSGQNYRAITATPGFTDRIQGYEGFWVILESGSTASPVLYMPQPE